MIFVGYMVVDTQEMIERAHHGDLDYVKHALTLFTDFIAVFVRILIIMVSIKVAFLLLSFFAVNFQTLNGSFVAYAVEEC